MLDRWTRCVSRRVSPESGVPILEPVATSVAAGGAGNVAIQLAELGMDVVLIGAKGQDEDGDRLVNTLGLVRSVEAIVVANGCDRTTVKERVFLDPWQQCYRLDVDGAATEAGVGKVLSEALSRLSEADLLVLSDYGKGVLGLRSIRELISAAKDRNVPVVADPKKRHLDAFWRADVVTPNLAEAELDAGESLARDDQIGQYTYDRHKRHVGTKAFVVTLGSRGLVYRTHEGSYALPALTAEPADVTGAGDAVVAGLAAALASGYPVGESIEIGNQLAALAVARRGTRPVTVEELNEFRAKNESTTDVRAAAGDLP